MNLVKLSLAAVLAVAVAAPVQARQASRLTIENAHPVSLEVIAESRYGHLYLGRIPANATRSFQLDRGDYKVTATTRYGDEQIRNVHVNRRGASLRFERDAGDPVGGRYDHSESWYRKWGAGNYNWRFETGR